MAGKRSRSAPRRKKTTRKPKPLDPFTKAERAKKQLEIKSPGSMDYINEYIEEDFYSLPQDAQDKVEVKDLVAHVREKMESNPSFNLNFVKRLTKLPSRIWKKMSNKDIKSMDHGIFHSYVEEVITGLNTLKPSELGVFRKFFKTRDDVALTRELLANEGNAKLFGGYAKLNSYHRKTTTVNDLELIRTRAGYDYKDAYGPGFFANFGVQLLNRLPAQHRKDFKVSDVANVLMTKGKRIRALADHLPEMLAEATPARKKEWMAQMGAKNINELLHEMSKLPDFVTYRYTRLSPEAKKTVIFKLLDTGESSLGGEVDRINKMVETINKLGMETPSFHTLMTAAKSNESTTKFLDKIDPIHFH